MGTVSVMRVSAFVLTFLSINLTAKEKPVKIEKIESRANIFKDELKGDIPSYWKKDLAWPSESEINLRQIPLNDVTVQYPVRSTMEWLTTILRSEWVPQESKINVIPLKAGVQGNEKIPYDSVRLRYRAGDYLIQVSSDSRDIVIIMKSINVASIKKDVFEAEEANRFANETVAIFFNEADQIPKTCDWKIRKINKSVEGVINNVPMAWWQSVNWSTDGSIIMFSIQKLDPNNPRRPYLIPNWFSSQNEKPKAKRLVTKS